MPTIGDGNLTLSDWNSRLDTKGGIDKVVEILNATNEILEDMVFIEGNLPTGHKHTIRSGLPSVAWRKLNYGVPPSKSRTVQVTETVSMLEAYSEVERKLADLNGNTAAFRLSEDKPFIERMNQAMAETVLYGDTDMHPERFLGMTPRYADETADNGTQIIDAGGAGAGNTSIWLIGWGDNAIHGIFPKGSMAGLDQRDLGEETLSDANGGLYQGYRTHFTWDMGLAVQDWRYAVRIGSIDVAEMATAANAKAVVTLLVRACERIPSYGDIKPAFYMNRGMRENLRVGILEKVSNQLTYENVAGKRVTQFDGIPVRRVDAILDTEALA